MLPLIDIFGLIQIPTYSAAFMVGFLLLIILARKISPEYHVDKHDVTYASIYAAIGILIGSKIFYFLTKLPYIVKNFTVFTALWNKSPLAAVNYCFGGLVFYGGLIGAVLGAYIYCRQYKLSFLPFLDIFPPLIPLAHGFGRLGCFLSGCCYGIEYHGFGSVQFPYNELAPELSAVPRVPVQLIEACANFIMFIILYAIQRRKCTKPGQLMGIYLLYYTVVRYLLELLRGDVIRGKIGIFSTSQLISLLLVPIAIILIRGRYIAKKKHQRQIYP